MELEKDAFQVFVLTDGIDKDIGYLLGGLREFNFTVFVVNDIKNGLAKLACQEADCLLFNRQTYSDYSQDIAEAIAKNRLLQNAPKAVAVSNENNDCLPELDGNGVRIINLPVSRLIFRQRIEELAELGYSREILRRNAISTFYEGSL